MKFKIKFNNRNSLFNSCEIEKQYLSHSKDKLKKLFSETYEIKDYKNNKGLTIDRANNILYYEIMCLFGSSQVDFFKIEVIK